MARAEKLPASEVEAWVSAHGGWQVAEGALVRSYALADFRAALAFVVSVGCWAERHDHHPDVELGWGRARFRWSTHDAGGITTLDLSGAEACDEAAPR